jgi:hypothetical protein
LAGIVAGIADTKGSHLHPLTDAHARRFGDSLTDLTKPLTAEQVSAIEAGRDRYAVLVFRDQPLTDEHGLRRTSIKGIAFTAEQAQAITAE